MRLRRRMLLLAAPGLLSARPAPALEPRPLVFPRDHGAHPDARIEWWYVTGWLQRENDHADAPAYGWQITFFRVSTGIAAGHPSAFAAEQLLLAHAALSDLGAGRLRHAQQLARSGFGIASFALDDTRLVLRDWSLQREAASGRYRAHAGGDGFRFDLALQPTQGVLLQGDAGWSRKGPRIEQASRYVSQPQLDTRGSVRLDGRDVAVRGRAWLDHEWSDEYLDREAVGWDWIGINLDDGAALMAFRIRRADGSALWAGGSYRAAGAAEARDFAPDEVRFEPGRRWSSAATGASYPVHWKVQTPAGRFAVRALLDAQELDARAGTGTAYWEGLSELLDEAGRRVGLGYLEMTGYAGRLSF